MLIIILFIVRSPVVGTFTAGSELEKLFLKDGWIIQSSDLVIGDGAIIAAREFSPVGWYATSVPSTVLAALVENGVYPDPYFGVNLKSIPDLTGSSWWYRTEFVLPEEYDNRHIWLHFDGINYKANIWLNGQQIANSELASGAYRRIKLNITEFVVPGNNVLAVHIIPPKAGDFSIGFVDWNIDPPD